jgi:hypothetical protein
MVSLTKLYLIFLELLPFIDGINSREIHVKNTEYFVYDFSPPEWDLKVRTIINRAQS